MFKKNTIGAYLLMYMYMFILKIPLNSPQHVDVGGAWYESALYRINDMDCESTLLCQIQRHYSTQSFCPCMLAADTCTAAVGSSIGTAVGVSVSVTFVVSFSMGVLVASVLCYISRRSKGSSHKTSSHADPATVYDDVGSNKKMKGDAMKMKTNTAYRS